jgi:hypothetical protein
MFLCIIHEESVLSSNILKIDVLVHYIRRFCSQFTDNTVHAHYMHQLVEAA